MNDFSELEADLKKLRPHAASPELATRVERALMIATPTAGVLPLRRRTRLNWFALGLGLATATAFLLLARVPMEPTSRVKNIAAATPGTAKLPLRAITAANGEAGLLPVGLTQVTYRTQDEGLHFQQGAEQPVRRVRSRNQETLRWRNPETGASLRVSYPSEEVTLIPVSGQ